MKAPKSKMFNTKTATVILAVVLLIILVLPYSIRWKDMESAASNQPSSLLEPQKHHSETSKLLVRIVDALHYRNRPLDNEFSVEILDEYLNTLDPNRSYFRSSDIQEFKSLRLYFDDYLKSGKMDKVYEIFQVYQDRVAERTTYAKTLLDYPFDFQLDDELELDRSSTGWPFTQVEYDMLWRRIVKNEILNLKLADTDEKEITEVLARRYDRFNQVVSLTKADDVFEIFLNSYLNLIDPHSEYFSPHNSTNFSISMTQQIEGIGAMLRLESDFVTILSLIPGGPAARSDQLQPGDKIIALRNQEDDSFTEIIGWRLNDVVDKIRGPKGTQIKLKIVPADSAPEAPPVVVSIIRETVKIEDQIAKKSIIEFPTKRKNFRIGVISLPTFYSGTPLTTENSFDSGQDSSVSSSQDVRRILGELNNQKVDGVVVDLRGNGGGALQEAVRLTGLFIKQGPIVQVKNADGSIKTEDDEIPTIDYKGPLVVLVDRRSASASEIFAAAIKDYGRGIVVGETTFGKGGIQTLFPFSFDQKTSSGNVKLTTAQYYRVSGPSTQHIGVEPDIVFPNNEFVSETGERSFENSLPQSEIPPASVQLSKHASVIKSKLPFLRQLHEDRVAANPIFHYLHNDEAIRLNRSKRKVVNLNESDRRQLLVDFQSKLLQNTNDLLVTLGIEPVEDFGNDLLQRNILGDILLEESVNILVDYISFDGIENISSSQANQSDST